MRMFLATSAVHAAVPTTPSTTPHMHRYTAPACPPLSQLWCACEGDVFQPGWRHGRGAVRDMQPRGTSSGHGGGAGDGTSYLSDVQGIRSAIHAYED